MGRMIALRKSLTSLEERFEKASKALADDLARGRIGLLEYHRNCADLERGQVLELRRLIARPA